MTACPVEVQALADKQFALFSKNPSHPSLAVKNGNELTWFWIGTHAHYDKLLA
jgi:hypothetical protein